MGKKKPSNVAKMYNEFLEKNNLTPDKLLEILSDVGYGYYYNDNKYNFKNKGNTGLNCSDCFYEGMDDEQLNYAWDFNIKLLLNEKDPYKQDILVKELNLIKKYMEK